MYHVYISYGNLDTDFLFILQLFMSSELYVSLIVN